MPRHRVLDAACEDCFCLECGESYKYLHRHLRHRPACIPRALVEASDTDSDDDEPTLAVAEEQTTLAASARQDQVSWDLGTLRYELGLNDAQVAKVKGCVSGWLDDVSAEAAHNLQPLLRGNVSADQVHRALQANVFDGLETEARERTFVRETIPYLEPRRVDLGGGDEVVSFRVSDLLQRQMQHNAAFRKQVLATSEWWKRGEAWGKVPDDGICGWEDGVAARFHPHVLRPATLEEAHDVRIELIKQVDDVEVCLPPLHHPCKGPHTRLHRQGCNCNSQVCNALGVARGKQKQCGSQLAVGNLPPGAPPPPPTHNTPHTTHGTCVELVGPIGI